MVGRDLKRSLVQPPAPSGVGIRSDQAALGFIQAHLENLQRQKQHSCSEHPVSPLNYPHGGKIFPDSARTSLVLACACCFPSSHPSAPQAAWLCFLENLLTGTGRLQLHDHKCHLFSRPKEHSSPSSSTKDKHFSPWAILH